jgi:hypothetical protein
LGVYGLALKTGGSNVLLAKILNACGAVPIGAVSGETSGCICGGVSCGGGAKGGGGGIGEGNGEKEGGIIG